ncbi:MAG: hypothetical protein KatS3mg109_0247 [Pirellulaceae bacterium]|nr:MAG: hypothetical protein KatS3mg109_0247 [Pirellulaceae bacterium]
MRVALRRSRCCRAASQTGDSLNHHRTATTKSAGNTPTRNATRQLGVNSPTHAANQTPRTLVEWNRPPRWARA